MQVWLVILAVFGLGGITGVSLDRLYLSRAGTPPARGFGREPAAMAGRLKNDLKLSDEQTEAVRKIFEESRKAFPPSRLQRSQTTHPRSSECVAHSRTAKTLC